VLDRPNPSEAWRWKAASSSRGSSRSWPLAHLRATRADRGRVRAFHHEKIGCDLRVALLRGGAAMLVAETRCPGDAVAEHAHAGHRRPCIQACACSGTNLSEARGTTRPSSCSPRLARPHGWRTTWPRNSRGVVSVPCRSPPPGTNTKASVAWRSDPPTYARASTPSAGRGGGVHARAQDPEKSAGAPKKYEFVEASPRSICSPAARSSAPCGAARIRRADPRRLGAERPRSRAIGRGSSSMP